PPLKIRDSNIAKTKGAQLRAKPSEEETTGQEDSGRQDPRLGFGLGEHPGENLLCVVLADLASVFFAQPVDGLEYRYEVLEVSSSFGIGGVDCAEHLRGKQNIVDADSLDQKFHRFLVVNRHVPVDLAGDFFERLEAVSDVPAPLAVPLERDPPAAVGDDDLELGEILKDAGAENFDRRRIVMGDVVGVGQGDRR